MLGRCRHTLNPIARWKLSRLEKRLKKTQRQYIHHARNNDTARLCDLISDIAMLSNEKAKYEEVLPFGGVNGGISLKEFIDEVQAVVQESNLKIHETRRPGARRRVFYQGMHDIKKVLEACGSASEPD